MQATASRVRRFPWVVIAMGVTVCCWTPAPLWGHKPTFFETDKTPGMREYLVHGQLEAEAVRVLGLGASCGGPSEVGGPQVGAIPATFTNPVLPGSYPNPSICRAGAEYYLVNASQVWFPGLPIHRSRDLVHWELVGYVLDRPGRLSWAEGVAPADGIWTPTIRYRDGRFYVMATVRGGGGFFYATAADPRGPWSDPVWLAGPAGAAPSLFFDEAGTSWLVTTRAARSGGGGGRLTVCLQQVDLQAGAPSGPVMSLAELRGVSRGANVAPRLCKIDGTYCLLIATADDPTDQGTLFCSDALTGPYRSDPGHAGLLAGRWPGGASWSGQADWIHVADNDAWAVLTGVRSSSAGCLAGPETFLASVRLEDGRPVIGSSRDSVDLAGPRPDLGWSPLPRPEPQDDFEAGRLALGWNTFYPPADDSWWSLSDRRGYLRLHLLPAAPTDAGPFAVWARRVQHVSFRATARMEFKPRSADETAGLILMQDHTRQYRLEVALVEGGPCVSLVRVAEHEVGVIARRSLQGRVFSLGVRGRGSDLEFLAGDEGDDLFALAGPQDGSFLGGRASGAFVGIYASGGGQASDNVADFDWFEYDGR